MGRTVHKSWAIYRDKGVIDHLWGVSLYAVPYVNWSHQDADIAEALDRIDQAARDLAGS